MRITDVLSKVAGSRVAGHSLRAAKLLSFAGTLKGAIATALVVAGTVGGAATVTTAVREELDRQGERAEAAAQSTESPPSTPSIRSRGGAKLAATLADDIHAVDALRRITSLGQAELDALVNDTKQRLQARYEAGLALLDALVAEPAGAAESGPSAGIALVLDALVQVITEDLGSIVEDATKLATGQRAAVAAPSSPPPALSAVSVDSLRADAEARLQSVIAADGASLDGLRGAPSRPGLSLDQLISDTKLRLQNRYGEGLGLLSALLSDSAAAVSASTVSAVDALVGLITKDLNTITQSAMLTASATASPTATQAIFLPPYVLPRLAPPHTATPTPHTATPAPHTPTPSPHTAVPTPSPRPSVRTATPPPATPQPSASH